MATSVVTIYVTNGAFEPLQITGLSGPKETLVDNSLMLYQYLDRWTVAPGHSHKRAIIEATGGVVDPFLSFDSNEKKWSMEIVSLDEGLPEMIKSYIDVQDRNFLDHELIFLFTLRQCLLAVRSLKESGITTGHTAVEGAILGGSSAIPPHMDIWQT